MAVVYYVLDYSVLDFTRVGRVLESQFLNAHIIFFTFKITIRKYKNFDTILILLLYAYLSTSTSQPYIYRITYTVTAD